MSDQPNPYQPPAQAGSKTIVAEADWGSMPDGRIPFEVSLRLEDVARLFPSPLPIVLVVSLGVILLLLLAIGNFPLVFIILSCAVIGLLVFVRTRLNWKMAVRQSPRLLTPTSGYITPHGIFASSDGAQGFHRWDDFHGIRSTRQCLVLSGENWRLVSLLIPWSSFGEPGLAREALQSVIDQRKSWQKIPLGDPRLLAEPTETPMFEPIEPHVPFDGEITLRQVASSAPGRKLHRTTWRLIPVILVMLLLAAVTALAGKVAVLFISFPLLVFSLAIMIQLVRHPLLRRNRDAAIFRLRGWFAPTGLFLQSISGQSLRQWRSLQNQWHNDQMLCISLPGSSQAWFFFSRSQFANDQDFRQACQWAEAGLGENV